MRSAIGGKRDVDGTVQRIGNEALDELLHDRSAIQRHGQAGAVNRLDDQFARVIAEAPIGGQDPHARDVARPIERDVDPFRAGLPLAGNPSRLDVAVERALQTIAGVARRGDEA